MPSDISKDMSFTSNYYWSNDSLIEKSRKQKKLPVNIISYTVNILRLKKV